MMVENKQENNPKTIKRDVTRKTDRRFFGFKKEKSEFEQKVLDIRRVARVVAGGKRFRFRATVVVGDRKGRVGVGIAKGADTSESIERAARTARKELIVVLMKNNTIPFEVYGKFSSARVLLKPARQGRGIVAGGAVRAVVSLGGIGNIVTKILGTTTNKLNNARAAIEALKKLKIKPSGPEPQVEGNPNLKTASQNSKINEKI